MAKLKISIEERRRALDLLAEGHSIENAAKHLHQTYHPQRSLDEVKKTYFPPTGFAHISNLVGASKARIETRFRQIIRTRAKIGKAGAKTFRRLFKDSKFAAQNRERARARTQKLFKDPSFRERHAARNREKWQKYFADAEQIKAHRERSRQSLKTLHRDPLFRAANAERMRLKAIAAWRNSEFRAKKTEQARQIFGALQTEPAFRARHVAKMKKLWGDPQYRALQSRMASRRLRELWKDPHYRILQEARNRLKSHKAKLERALNFFEAQQPGAWETETGGKKPRALVAVHIPQLGEAIDTARQMRKMLKILPARQRILLSKFFGINLEHSAKAIRDAEDLRPHEVKAELKAAMETLAQNPVLKKLLEEE